MLLNRVSDPSGARHRSVQYAVIFTHLLGTRQYVCRSGRTLLFYPLCKWSADSSRFTRTDFIVIMAHTFMGSLYIMRSGIHAVNC